MSTTAESLDFLRHQIADAVAAGRDPDVCRLLADLWRASPSPATAQFIVSRYQEMRDRLPLRPLRVDIERSFTLEPAVVVLRAKGFLHGFDLDIRLGGFDAVASEMLDASSPLYVHQPDVVILAVQTRSIAPDLWQDFSSLTAAQVDAAVERVSGQMKAWVQAFRENSSAHLILHLLDTPVLTSSGLLDGVHNRGQRQAIARINGSLRELASATPGVWPLDYDGLMARHGRLGWEDPVRWATMRLPLAATSLAPLADEWLRYLHPVAGHVAKVLVCDLDNTLWGGVLGEEGIDGIRLGPDYPGTAFQSLQRALLDLHHRGILLAISSKNDPDEALAAIADHPGMLLRSEHFAAFRIGWTDKAAALREIAAELNVGTDALAFLDDNPHERQWVRSQMPEVWVIDLPPEPALYERVVLEQPVFERLTLTDEDRRRATMYAEQRQRRELQHNSASLEEYYRSLGLVVQVEPAGPDTLDRAAQLINKTNQFNLTGRRFSLQELTALAGRDDALVLVARVRDRFGDSGIVGVVAGEVAQPDLFRIDAFVMSCRVIGRTVETAMLAGLVELLGPCGVRRVGGAFVPSARNAPARDFYPRHGFACIAEEAARSAWELDLDEGSVACPPWIEMIVPQESMS